MSWISRIVRKAIVDVAKAELQAVAMEQKRLEMKILQLDTELEAVAASHHKLLKRSVGRLSNQGRGSDQETAVTALDSIAKGDKAALRQHFAGEIARRGPGAHRG